MIQWRWYAVERRCEVMCGANKRRSKENITDHQYIYGYMSMSALSSPRGVRSSLCRASQP